MNAADDAFETACRKVAQARAMGQRRLHFNHARFRALDRLPPEIAELRELRLLDLYGTRVETLDLLAGLTALQRPYLSKPAVRDITPLGGLTRLLGLGLDQTAVRDLAPLSGLADLQGLGVERTAVEDLRPIRDLARLGEGPLGGLRFRGTPAALRDVELRRLSEIEDNARRTRETLAYLKTLRPAAKPAKAVRRSAT